MIAAIIDDYEKYITLWPYKAVAIINCFTIFIYSLGLYFYAQYVRSKLIIPPESQVSQRPLQESSLDEELAAQDLEKRLLKMNVVLGLCSLCYFFRVVCLSFVLIDVERSETSTDSISLFLWFTLSLWIPSLGSVSE